MGRGSQNFYQWQIDKICYCTSSPSSSPNNHLNPIHNGSIIKSSKRDLIYKLIFNNSWDISVKFSRLMSGYLILRWSKSRKADIYILLVHLPSQRPQRNGKHPEVLFVFVTKIGWKRETIARKLFFRALWGSKKSFRDNRLRLVKNYVG